MNTKSIRRTAIAATSVLALSLTPGVANAQLMSGVNASPELGAVFLITAGVTAVVIGGVYMDVTATSTACSSGPMRDRGTCDGYIAGEAGLIVGGLGLIGVGIYIFARPTYRSRSALERFIGEAIPGSLPPRERAALAPDPALRTLELVPTGRGLALRGTF